MSINPTITRRILLSPRTPYTLYIVAPRAHYSRVDVKRDLGILQINTLDQHHHTFRGTFLLSRSFMFAGFQTPLQ